MKATIESNLKSNLKGLQINYSFGETPFASVCIASTLKGLCSVSLVKKGNAAAVESLQKKFAGAIISERSMPEHQQFLQLFENKKAELSFHLLGTDFQIKVWNALLDIPLGSTTTYGAVATIIGHPNACRAVGSAVGDNPIFFAIPCHRVLPASGGVGNYFWGAALKKEILTWENAILTPKR